MAPPARSLANVIYLDGAPRIDGSGGGQTGEEEIGRVAMVQAQQPRWRGIGTRAWLIVSESGHLHVEKIEKHSIMGWTGLPAHDLLVLDLVLSYPSSILGREQAVVINLEHIKAVITAKEVLMINTNSPLTYKFPNYGRNCAYNPQFLCQKHGNAHCHFHLHELWSV